MKIRVLAEADDVRGFRLAGVDARICRTREDVDRAVAELLDDRDEQVGVVLVSESVYRRAADAIDAARDRPQWPIVVVLPEAAPGQGRTP